jgi:hypothetical protein
MANRLVEWRLEAKALLASLRSGDNGAVKRVLTAHPKYAGKAPERLRIEALSLLDAQLTIASEHHGACNRRCRRLSDR